MIKLILIELFILSQSFSGYSEKKERTGIKVNQFIGTSGSGNVITVAVAPYGMVQPGPDTRNGGSGYYYSDKAIPGFSHTHKTGGGCGDFQYILLQPTTGIFNLIPGDENIQCSGYCPKLTSINESKSYKKNIYLNLNHI